MNEPKSGYQFLTANALWIEGDLKSKIFKEIQKYYGAKVFIKTPPKKVNQWIENKTMNKFKNVVKKCKPTPFDKCGLSLINTIYFKGDWKQKFEKANTTESSFIINAKEKVKVPMMYMRKRFNYMETETMQMLEMPYKDEKLSMLVLLPKDFPGKSKERYSRRKTVTKTIKNIKADLISLVKALTEKNIKQWREYLYSKREALYSLEKTLTEKNIKQWREYLYSKREALYSLEKTLTEKNIKQWREALYSTRVDVYIPKFTFKKDYDLKKTLEKYMPSAFDKQKADFAKFSKNKKLYIRGAIHKSFVNVNEEGTEAAAVTVLGIRVAVSLPPVFKVFKANHPFIFLIQERETGQILFIGKVVNPTIRK